MSKIKFLLIKSFDMEKEEKENFLVQKKLDNIIESTSLKNSALNKILTGLNKQELETKDRVNKKQSSKK